MKKNKKPTRREEEDEEEKGKQDSKWLFVSPWYLNSREKN